MAQVIFISRRLAPQPMYDMRTNMLDRGVWMMWRNIVPDAYDDEDVLLLQYEEYSWPRLR